ncbi:caspase family protein [Rhizobium sp. ZPR3]|uniref:Caspase family protein n=2 Tax=unclassified Rhizobium TaxID=2613769 RepID=A0AAU7SEL5_9HYPH
MRKAFVIGLGQFADVRIPALPAAEKDAEAILATLTDPVIGSVDPEQTRLLLSPTHNMLRAALSAFLAGMMEGDEFVLFLAGHAYPQSSGRLIFPCQDSRIDRLSTTGFSERDLHLLIAERPGLRGILVLDTCFAGSFGQVKSALKARGEQPLIPPPPEQSALAIIYSARARELAYESSDSGLFTGLLIEGLRAGAGCPETQQHVTPADIVDWIKAKMRYAKLSEQFWPGLREGKAVAGLALSRNPGFSVDARIGDAAEARAERTLAKIVMRMTGAEDGYSKLRGLAEFAGKDQPLPPEEGAEIVRVTKREVAVGWFRGIAGGAFLTFLAFIIFSDDSKLSLMAAVIVAFVLVVPALVETLSHDRRIHFLLFNIDGFVLSKGHRNDQRVEIYIWSDVTAVRIESVINQGGFKSSKLVIEARGKGLPLEIDESTYPVKIEVLREMFLRWLHMRMSIMPVPKVAPLKLAEGDGEMPFQRVMTAAALVGVWDYSHLPRLSAPEHDLTRLNAVLAQCGVTAATCANPELAAFESWLGDSVYAAAGQILLLVFSGHGIVAGDELMLAFPGTRPERLAETAFPVAKLVDVAADARVRHLILVLDCCMSGASGAALGLTEANLSELFETDRGLITVLAATADDQEAYAPQGAPSFFTAAIADAIEACLALKRQASLIAISDEAAERLSDIGLGQRHWRFASDAAHGIALSPPPTIGDKVAEQHASIELKQLTSLRHLWEYVAVAEFSTGDYSVEISFGGKAIGKVFVIAPWKAYAVPRGCSIPLIFITVLAALTYLLSAMYSEFMWAALIGAGLGLLLRGSRKPRSSLVVSVYGIAKDGVLYPSVNIASTLVSSSRYRVESGGETTTQEWQLYERDGKKTVLAQSAEPWGESIEAMQQAADKFLAEGKIEALNDLLSVQFQHGEP